MLVVVLSWVYYFLLCLSVGIGVEKGLAKLFGKRWTFQVIDYLVAGMVAITLYAGFFSIIYKVGMIAHLLLLAAAITLGYFNRDRIKVLLLKGKKLCFSWEGFFLLCFLLLLAFFTSREPFIRIRIFIMHRISAYMRNMGSLREWPICSCTTAITAFTWLLLLS